MFEPVGQNTQGECLGTCDGLLVRLPISQHAWKVAYLGNPATVCLLLDFYVEYCNSPLRTR